MRFDPELMRDILLKIEEQPAGGGEMMIHSDAHSVTEVGEHMRLLIKEGYLEGEVLGRPSDPIFWMRGLTMQGHEFLANARSKGVWDSVVEEASKHGIVLGITVLGGLLLEAAKRKAGLR